MNKHKRKLTKHDQKLLLMLYKKGFKQTPLADYFGVTRGAVNYYFTSFKCSGIVPDIQSTIKEVVSSIGEA